MPLECYLNGAFDLRPLSEAHRRFYEADFAIVPPLDRGRSRWHHPPELLRLEETVGASGLEFLFALLTQDHPLTQEGFWKRLRKDQPDDCGAFAKRASRAKLFLPKKLREKNPLLEPCKVIDRLGIARKAYCVKPGVSTIVITGVDADYRQGRPVPLGRLLAPPE